MSEEDYKKLHPVLSEVTKTYVDQIDDVLKNKESELLEV